MNQSALESPESNAETLRALAGQYIDRHSGVENHVVYFSLEVWLLRRLGLEPLSWLGCLVGYIIHFLMVLLPALILTAITGQWASIPLLSWIIVAATYAGLAMTRNPLLRPAIRNLLSWLWAIVDEVDLQRLIAWERKWFSHRVSIPMSGALTLGTILSLYFLALRGSDVPAGTAYVGGFVVFLLAQSAYGYVMMAFEASNLSTCKYDLYRLSPADSVVVRRSLRGYNQFGALAVMIMTVLLLLLVILLPGGSGVVAPVVLSLLLVDYVCTAVGTLIPRFLMGRIVRAEKEEEMEILQVRLNDLLPQLEELTEEEYDKMVRLQEPRAPSAIHRTACFRWGRSPRLLAPCSCRRSPSWSLHSLRSGLPSWRSLSSPEPCAATPLWRLLNQDTRGQAWEFLSFESRLIRLDFGQYC